MSPTEHKKIKTERPMAAKLKLAIKCARLHCSKNNNELKQNLERVYSKLY